MKTAEFTDHASAAAFIAAGRKKGERATSDGWNTVLYERGSDYVLELHGTEIVRYNSARIEITIPMRNHVVADRIQRYGFADNFQLNTVGGKWSLSQAWATMPGIKEDPTIWYPVVGEIPAVVTLDDTGMNLITPAGAPKPAVLSAVDRYRILEKPLKAWLSQTMKLLDAGWTFSAVQWNECPLCLPVEGIPGQNMLGSLAISNGHLMSHVLENVVLPSTIVGLMTSTFNGMKLLNANIGPSGDGSLGKGAFYNHDAVRRTLKSAIRNSLR